jgi:hypothetical protein
LELKFYPEYGEEIEGTKYVVAPHHGVQTGLTDQANKVYKNATYAEIPIWMRE